MTVLLNFEEDSTAWINSQLSASTNGTEALQAAQSLLNQVQLTASQLTRDLQAVTDSTSQTLKTRLSVQDVKTKTSGLSRRIQGALAQLAPLNSSESPSKGVPAVSTAHQDEAFSNLITLDLVVGRMEKTRNALKEAENWNSLAMEMEAIFDSRNYEKAAARLEEASRSLALLSATPEYEDRKSILLKFQDTLEKSLVPQLKTALETRDAESTVKLYNVYSTIQKRARFEACLFEAQAGTLLESWTDFNVDTSVQIALSKHLDPAGVFIDWLSKFLISLHSLFVTEWEWIGPLLPDAQSLILGLINYTFTQLDPRLKSRLDTFLRVLGPSSFPVISTAYKVTVEFGHRVEKSLSAVIFNGLNHSSGSDQQDDEPGVWGLPVFEEFVPFQVDYGVYERTALLQVLASVLEDSRKSTNHMDLVRTMPEAIQKLVSHAELAVKRCALLTLGFSTPGLVESLNDYFSGIVDRFGKILLQVRSETTVVSHANTAQSGTSTPNGSLYERQSSSVFGEDDYEIQRDELGRQEWSHFQMGLRVLSSTLALAGKVETEFEGLAIGLLRKVDGILQGTSNAKESEGDDAVCASSLLALRLSSLNSRELQGFIQKLVHGKTATDKDEPLFTPASLAISQLAIKAQRYLYDTLFLPIEKRLSVIPLMEVWTATGPQNPSPFDLELPQFSLSPGEYMTRIGEHLLSLPQQLDLYADDASLAYSTGSLPGMMDRGVSSELKEDGQTLHEEEDEEVDITYLWMTSVSIGTMSSFVSFASQIPTLSISGTSQLVADMRYLVNVLSAMEILPSKEFSMLMEGLSMDLETLQRLQERVRDMSLTTEIPDDLSGYASLVAEFPDLFSRIVSQRLGGGVNNTV